MDNLISIKNSICIGIGLIGGTMASALGGADKLLIAFIICVGVDYFTGLAVALIFKNSPKTKTGGAESSAGFKGLVKKAFIFLIIVVINQVDIVLGSGGFIRNAAIIGFMTNECISLIENAGLMGIDLPPAVINAIDILKRKSEDKKGMKEEK
ncbi:holin family protein [Clostridium sp. CF012]|uniref:phage holin family protein n=1 Tax=Clostridium sp. CF012 TaxID=2843319 RepID=UPI001C0ADD03|nr:phage holin family protein [Clostridium sp. CF012]MBU3146837.1 phage holin family protein [Clostridium sp. CF012]